LRVRGAKGQATQGPQPPGAELLAARRLRRGLEGEETTAGVDEVVHPDVVAVEAVPVPDDVPRTDAAVPRAAPASLAEDGVDADRPDLLGDLAAVAGITHREGGTLTPARLRIGLGPVAGLAEADDVAVTRLERGQELDAADHQPFVSRPVSDQLCTREGRGDLGAEAGRGQQTLLQLVRVEARIRDPREPAVPPLVLVRRQPLGQRQELHPLVDRDCLLRHDRSLL